MVSNHRFINVDLPELFLGFFILATGVGWLWGRCPAWPRLLLGGGVLILCRGGLSLGDGGSSHRCPAWPGLLLGGGVLTLWRSNK